MKNIISFSVLVFSSMIFFSISLYSQSAWVTQNSGTNNDLWYVTFINENMGYAVGEGGTIIKTTNGGNIWSQQSSGTNDTLFCVHFINVNTGSIVGEDGEIRRTTNGGTNWITQTSNTANTLRSVYFVDANTGMASGFNGIILKTTNGGNNWFLQTSNTNQNFWSIFLLNANTGWAVGFSGTVRKTTNSGMNWFTQSVNNNTAQLLYVAFLNANTGIITVGIPGNIDIYTTSNGGNSWQPKDFASGHSHRSVDIIDSNIWMMVGDAGDFYRSTDGGSNWSFLPLGISNWLLSTSFANTSTGWAVGTSGIILKTTTGGIPLPIPVLISPPNWSHNVSLTPTLMWSNVNGIIYYHVQVSTVSDFSIITDSATVTNNQYTIPEGKLSNAITYFWRVNATTSPGTGPWSEIWNFSTLLVNIKQTNSHIPGEFKLFQNYPNPFNPSTSIRFDIPISSHVRITIYNNLGKTISEVVNENLTAGSYEVNWEAINYTSGIYFYRIITDEFIDVKKMLLIK